MSRTEQILSHIKSAVSETTRDKMHNPDAKGVSPLAAFHERRAIELMTPEERKLALPEQR
jgi:hypothetical protein